MPMNMEKMHEIAFCDMNNKTKKPVNCNPAPIWT